MRVVALIPAAGRGERLARGESKAFLPLAGKPMLAYSLSKLSHSASVHGLVPIVASDDLSRAWELIQAYRIEKVCQVVAGGATRQESVARGLVAAGEDWDIVLIHDGARPLVETRLIEEAVAAAKTRGAVAPAIISQDTVRLVSAQGRYLKRLNRQEVALVQTPQAFLFSVIKEAHHRAQEEGFQGPDDAALVEHLGHEVWMIPGSVSNIKITTAEDLLLAEALLRAQLDRYNVTHLEEG